ncbi:MAG: DUF6062 family protein [Eubacteriales bacterium]|nr:DUF6062 family protein [Eubacteriales bacterium]
MKEKIYTIPVHDAYNAQGGCPLCTLEQTLTDELLQYYLGPALMEPEVRIKTNDLGFCREHWRGLYNREENRLGLGLLIHTHTADVTDDLHKTLPQAIPATQKGLFAGKQKDFRDKILEVAEAIEHRTQTCTICERLDQTMQHYLDVIFHEYYHEPEFRKQFDEGHGYCLQHLALLLRGAAKYLGQNQAAEFILHLTNQQHESLEALRDDVEWFTQKFDYRNTQADWKNSKDALPRAIRKLNGRTDLRQ